MPTVIDELVLELDLDPTKFTQSQREAIDALRRFQEAAHKSATALESEGKKTENFFASLKREALATVAIFLGGRGVKEFVGYITDLDAATGRISRTMATAVEETSAWQGAIRMAGGTAEGAVSALAGLSGEMSRFQLTGQSAMLPVLSRLGISLYDQNRNLKTSAQLWLELSDSVKGMDPRAAASFLGMIPGANQDMINFALLGRKAMESYLKSAREAGTTTRESAAAAQEYQKSLSALDQSASDLGRTLVTAVAPALTTVLSKLNQLLKSWKAPDSPEGVEQQAGLRNKMVSRFGSPRRVLEWVAGSSFSKWLERKGVGQSKEWLDYADQLYGPEGADEKDAAGVALSGALRADAMRKKAAASDATPGGAKMPGYKNSAADVEARIRRSAIARGMDPEVAMTVAKNEGFFNYKSTVPGEDSVGPFQLYYGGGLGNVFTKKTGLDAHDPDTVQQQIDFALDHVKKNGWGAFHGWKGLPFAGVGSGPTGAAGAARAAAGAGGRSAAGGSSTTVTVGTIQVNAPNAKDAQGIAGEIEPALSRAVTAGAANYGAN